MRQNGFTLLELMITVSVMAILLAIAIPSFQSTIRTNRVASLTNDLVSALNLARSEAIKRGTRVTVCKTADPSASAPICDTGATWKDGWLIFVDDGATVGTWNTGEVRIRVGQPINSNVTITADASNNFSNYVSYMSNGVSQGGNNVASGDMVVCFEGISRTVSVNTTGRIRISSGTC